MRYAPRADTPRDLQDHSAPRRSEPQAARSYDITTGHCPTPGLLLSFVELHDCFEADGRQLFAFLQEQLAKPGTNINVLGYLTPDSGASWIFIWALCPWIVPGTRRRLAKPIRILQGSTSVMATEIVLIAVWCADAREPDAGNFLLLPAVPLDDFRSQLALFSTSVGRQLGIHFLDPPNHDAYAVRSTPDHSGWHFDYNEYPDDVPIIPVGRTPSNLFSLPVVHHNDFAHWRSLVSNRPYDPASDLLAIQQIAPDLRDLHADDVIANLPQPTRGWQRQLSALATAEDDSPPAIRHLRLALFNPGVCPERILSDVDPWFNQRYTIVLICAKPSPLRDLTQRSFPEAVIAPDPQVLLNRLRAGTATVRADVGINYTDCETDPTTSLDLAAALELQALVDVMPSPTRTTRPRLQARRRIAQRRGWNTAVDVVDGVFFGAHASCIRTYICHTRWNVPNWDLLTSSGCSTTPPPVGPQLLPANLVPSSLSVPTTGLTIHGLGPQSHLTWKPTTTNANHRFYEAIATHQYPTATTTIPPHLNYLITRLALATPSASLPLHLGLADDGISLNDHMNRPSTARLWLLLHQAFHRDGISASQFLLHIPTPPIRPTPFPSHPTTFGIATLGYFDGPAITTTGKGRITFQLDKPGTARNTTAGTPLHLQPFHGSLIVAQAYQSPPVPPHPGLPEQPLQRIVTLLDHRIPMWIQPPADPSTSHCFEDVLYSPPSARSSATTHFTGHFGYNINDLRTFHPSGPAPAIRPSGGIILDLDNGRHRYLTRGEIGAIAAPSDDHLHYHWSSLTMEAFLQEASTALPAATINGVYRSLSHLLATRPPPTLLDAASAALIAANTTTEPDAVDLDIYDAAILSAEQALQTHHELQHALEPLAAHLRQHALVTDHNADTVQSPTDPPAAYASGTMKSNLNKRPALRPLKIPSARKQKAPPSLPTSDWTPELAPDHRNFGAKLLAVSNFTRLLPCSGDAMERFIRANPALAAILGLAIGDSRYLRYLPPDDRRMRRLAKPGIRSHKPEYTSTELKYAYGERLAMDAAHLRVPCVFRHYSYLFVFNCLKTDFGLVFPAQDLSAKTVMAATLYARNYMEIRYGIKIRSIATDAASSIYAKELENVKLDVGISFEVLGRYESHIDSPAERYIRRLLDLAILVAAELRGTIIKGQQTDPDQYIAFAAIWAAGTMNLDASTPLLRRENLLTTPHAVLAGHSGNVDTPHALVPFAARVHWNPPDAHKRGDTSRPALYLCPADMNPIQVNNDGIYTRNHREHILIDHDGKFITTAQFSLDEHRPESRRYIIQQLITAATKDNPYLHDPGITPHLPPAGTANPPAPVPTDVAPPPDPTRRITRSTAGSAPPSTTTRATAGRATPSQGLPTTPTPDPSPTQATAGGAPSSTPSPLLPSSWTDKRPHVHPHRPPQPGDIIETLWTDNKTKQQHWHPTRVAHSQRDLKQINSDQGLPIPLSELRVIEDLSVRKGPKPRYTKHLRLDLHGITWRYPTSKPKSTHRHRTLNELAADAVLAHALNSLPPDVVEALYTVDQDTEDQKFFDQLLEQDCPLTTPSPTDTSTTPDLRTAIDDDDIQHITDLRTRFDGVTSVKDFAARDGSASDLKDCLRHNILAPKMDDARAPVFLDALAGLVAEDLEVRPSVQPYRVQIELDAHGFYACDEANDDTFFAHTASADIAENLFGTASATPAVEAIRTGLLDPSRNHFGQNTDPNLDLRGSLDDLGIDYAQLDGIYVTFDAKAHLPGDGPDIKPGDLAYDFLKIRDLQNVPEKDREPYTRALVKEFEGLAAKGVLRVAIEPADQKAIPSKLVLKVKYNSDGSYDKHKVRCVIKGYLSQIGIDFYSTFSPTTMMATSRIVMAAAVHNGLPVRHADIPQAFIQSDADRPIYAKLPTGIGVSSPILEALRQQHPHGNVCFRLLKSLYGLASAPMIFNRTLTKFLTDLGMTRTRVDSTLFYRVDPETGTWTVVTAFVDDLLITGNDDKFQTKLKAALYERFGTGLTWADNVSSFLGLNCKSNYSNTRLTMNAPFKIGQLFERLNLGQFGHLHKQCQAPYQDDFYKMKGSDTTPLTPRQAHIKKEFRTICGVLIYLSITCRPDIVTVLNKCCQGMSDPKRQHIVWLERLLVYLHFNRTQGLVYQQSGDPLNTGVIDVLTEKYTELQPLRTTPYACFSDANFADASDDRLRSTSGHCIFLHGCLIIWSSRRQTVTARSTLESEFIAAASAADECVWLYQFAQAVPFLFDLAPSATVPPVPLLVDNLPAISTANHPKMTAQNKHIDLRHYRIRDYSGEDGEPPRIRCYWCPTKLNIADHFTKMLPRLDFIRLTKYLVDVPAAATVHADGHPTQGNYHATGPTDLPPFGFEPPQIYLNASGHHASLDRHRAAHDDTLYTFFCDTDCENT